MFKTLNKKIISITMMLFVALSLIFLSVPSVFALDKGSSLTFYNYTGSGFGGAGTYLIYQGNTNMQIPLSSLSSSDNFTKDIASYNSAATSATWTIYRGSSNTTPLTSSTSKVLSISYGTWYNYYGQSGSESYLVIKVTNIQYNYSSGVSVASYGSSPSGTTLGGGIYVQYNSNPVIPKATIERPITANISMYADNAISATWTFYDLGTSSTVPEFTKTGPSINTSGWYGYVLNGTVVIKVTNIQYADEQVPAISGETTFVTSVAEQKAVSYFQGFLSAYDNLDGDLTDEIYIITDNYTPNKAALGTYTVTFGVQDSAGNLATLVVNVQVVDVTKPVITGNSSPVYQSYTNTYNIESFRAGLTVTDNYYTMANSTITVKTDNYTANKTNPGTYTIIFTATDPSGNVSNDFVKTIVVIDDIAPVFSGPTTIQKPATSILTVKDIKAQLTATDAKDGTRTANIVVKTDGYTGHGAELGTYTIVFEVADTKNNKSTHTVTINVIDDIAPIWFVADGVSIQLVSPATMTRQQIIDLLIATGQIEVGSTSQVTFVLDEYTGNEDQAGVYAVSIEFRDAQGNESIHNMAITVLDNEDDPITLNPDAPWYQFAVDSWDWIKTHPWESVLIGLGTLLVLGIGLAIISGNKKKNSYYHK